MMLIIQLDYIRDIGDNRTNNHKVGSQASWLEYIVIDYDIISKNTS